MSDAQPAAEHEWADLWEKYMLENRALRAEIQAAKADLDALTRIVSQAIVASSLAPGWSVTNPPQHAIFTAVERLRARAEAAEARAAQAEADARLMAGLAFAGFVARTSFSAEIVDASLLDMLEAAGDRAAEAPDADLIAAARRILAAGGAA